MKVRDRLQFSTINNPLLNAACSLTSPSPFLALSLIVTQTPFFDEDDKKAFAQVETLSLMLCLHPFSCEPVPR